MTQRIHEVLKQLADLNLNCGWTVVMFELHTKVESSESRSGVNSDGGDTYRVSPLMVSMMHRCGEPSIH